ncbi:MAG TPA: ATP-binding protein [Anaerolineae bacterium]|nr:ATP-binding protein [Anaerolineae bacterium]
MLHRLVERQLKKLGLDEATLPEIEVWQQFLERVSQSYTEADRDRYLLERSLTISSSEMQEQATELRAANEKLLQEITEHKQTEKALALARDQALAASRLKTELLAKVSHELRTPLGAILGFAELLQFAVYGPVSEEQHEAIGKIIESANDLTDLVNQLLNQAQLDAGKLKLNLSAFAPAELVDRTLSKMNLLAQAKGLTLTANISADMPATLFGDPVYVQQILVNLVSNALKFTHQGTIHVEFYRPNDAHWILQVSDTGPGIPIEAQAYIFEPFRQVDGSMTREQGGAGLGLSIVKQLTELMGGQVTLVSEVGRGTTFIVQLPVTLVQEEINQSIIS